MADLFDKLTKMALEFRDERNWAQFHSGKDLAMCLSIESSEVQGVLLWKKDDEIDKERLKDEIGDVFYSLLLLANHYSIDIEKAFNDKLRKNIAKYPVEVFKNSNKKYNEDK